MIYSNKGRKGWPLLVLAAFFLLASCEDPAKVDVQLPETGPQVKVTSYTKALSDLGLMSEIYGTGALKIQANPIGDNTGTSGSTGGEIPRDITEMIKSSLNAIGGNVIYIPYDPAFIQNNMVTGYSSFDAKMIPDVVVTGGITEFDRGLETRGKGNDASMEADFNVSKHLSSKVGFDYRDEDKTGLSRITLDFNLVNFKTMAGIPRMNTTNSIEVHKAMAEKELGITLFGASFGRKGSIKKVQGRHAAVRLLVEASMIQIVGKHLVLPYWRLLGDDALPDDVVMTAFAKSFYRMSEPDRIAAVQEWLFLHGHDVPVNGVMDQRTLNALRTFNPNAGPPIDVETATKIYMTIPIDNNAYARRLMLAGGQAPAGGPAVMPDVVPQAQAAPQPAPAAPAPQQQPVAVAPQAAPAPQASAPKTTMQAAPKAASQPAPRQASVAAAPAPQPASARPTTQSTRAIGRILSDSDW